MQAILSLLEMQPTVLRGNASEIMVLAGASGASTRGVDSRNTPAEALDSGKALAKKYRTIVAITGQQDFVSCYVYHICAEVEYKQETWFRSQMGSRRWWSSRGQRCSSSSLPRAAR